MSEANRERGWDDGRGEERSEATSGSLLVM